MTLIQIVYIVVTLLVIFSPFASAQLPAYAGSLAMAVWIALTALMVLGYV